jgi:hypothetical protein
MYSGKLIKKDGKLIYYEPTDKLGYAVFVSKIKDGQVVDMYLDLADADHSKAQLAKVHACIRELATESGYTFDDMKLIIKDSSGLNGKSFADCSKKELMLAIEACIQIGGENFNINLH